MILTILDYENGQTLIKKVPLLDNYEEYIVNTLDIKLDNIYYMVTDELNLDIEDGITY